MAQDPFRPPLPALPPDNDPVKKGVKNTAAGFIDSLVNRYFDQLAPKPASPAPAPFVAPGIQHAPNPNAFFRALGGGVADTIIGAGGAVVIGGELSSDDEYLRIYRIVQGLSLSELTDIAISDPIQRTLTPRGIEIYFFYRSGRIRDLIKEGLITNVDGFPVPTSSRAADHAIEAAAGLVGHLLNPPPAGSAPPNGFVEVPFPNAIVPGAGAVIGGVIGAPDTSGFEVPPPPRIVQPKPPLDPRGNVPRPPGTPDELFQLNPPDP